MVLFLQIFESYKLKLLVSFINADEKEVGDGHRLILVELLCMNYVKCLDSASHSVL